MQTIVPRRNRRMAFTLVELLVVIAIIGILIGMLLPAVQQVREAARRTTCLNQMRQFSLGLLNYESGFGEFPPSRVEPEYVLSGSDPTNNPGAETTHQSWSTLILPYIEQVNLADTYDYQQAWFDAASSNNLTTVGTQVSLFQCPSAPSSNRTDQFHIIGAAAGDYGTINEVKKRVYTDVLGLDDPGDNARAGVLSKYEANPMGRIQDGTSNTFMLAECAGQPEVYVGGKVMNATLFSMYTDDKVVEYNGGYVPTDGTGWADPDCGFSINGATPDGLNKYGPAMINAINVSEAYSFHAGGANFAMSDGSTHFVRENVNALTFVQLCTRAGGEVIDGDY